MAQQTFNGTKINVEFDEATSRQQLNSGENISTLFGKIKKIFSDLKSVCFSGSYKDLDDIPSTATSETDGLMSASDKAKLDGADDTYALKSLYGDTTINVGRKAGSDVGKYSTAEGSSTTASGAYSHAEGHGATASGIRSHAEGFATTASGEHSHAEGIWTISSGNNSHAEGSRTTSNGGSSHIEGVSYNEITDVIPNFSSDTTNNDIITVWKTKEFSLANGTASHVEGKNNLALGYASHAEGCNTVAIGDNSHTSGCFTKVLHENEAAYGKYNESNENTLFSIGDGTADDARHNAFEITATGGKLHNKDIATLDDIPTSLPANGGNADTVDGKHASDFKAYQRYAPIYTGDLLDMAEMGTYSCRVPDVTNLPPSIQEWCYVSMIQFHDAGYRRYICSPFNNSTNPPNELYLAIEYLKDSEGKLIWRNISDGGNADTIGGIQASDIRQITKNTIQTLPTPPTAEGDYFVANADETFPYYFGNLSIRYGSYTAEFVAMYQTTGDNQKMWFNVYRGGWSGWKEISTTPIKKMTFTGVAIYEGGGGILFSIEHGTPIAIACTSRRATQCTQFVADNTWYVLVKDAATLDPAPQGSYSFDVWYI